MTNRTAAPLTRPAIRYHGGKWVLAPWIIDHLPADHECYVEPFGGGASVLLRKPPSPIEVYNDLDSEVSNFFRVLRDRAEDLARAVELTPYSREEQRGSYSVELLDELERARRFFVRCWQSRGANSEVTGWRFMLSRALRGSTPIDDWRDVERLYALSARLREVYIEQDAALNVIKRFDGARTLFYCDPPYVFGQRAMQWRANGYRHEMTDEDHRALAASLHEIRGMVVLSGYHSPLYDELYGTWERVERETNTHGKAGSPGRATEVLWLSPAAVTASRRRMML